MTYRHRRSLRASLPEKALDLTFNIGLVPPRVQKDGPFQGRNSHFSSNLEDDTLGCRAAVQKIEPPAPDDRQYRFHDNRVGSGSGAHVIADTDSPRDLVQLDAFGRRSLCANSFGMGS